MSFWQNLMEYAYMASITVAAIAGVPALFKNLYPCWKIFACFLIVEVVVECVAFYLSFQHTENQYLYNWLAFFEAPVKMFLFYTYTDGTRLKKTVGITIIAYILFSVINDCYIQPDINRLQTNIIIIGGLLMMVLAILHYAYIYYSNKVDRITADPVFWIATNVLITSAPMLPFYGMLNYLVDNYRDFAIFYLVYVMNFFFIGGRICIVVSFLKLSRTGRLRTAV